MARHKSTSFSKKIIKHLNNKNMLERIPTEKIDLNGKLSKNNEKSI